MYSTFFILSKTGNHRTSLSF